MAIEAAPAARTNAGPPASPPDVERLAIPGLTGVAIDLEIAGPGSRSYAFLIDWHIRVLLALAWFAAAWLPARLTRDAPASGRHFLLGALLPALLIYLLYQPVVELLMRGRSPGKRMAGVRLVTRTGGTPGVGALLIRNIFRLVDGLPILYVIGLICCFVTPQRVRIGDLAAGTLLVVAGSEPDSALKELATLTESGLSPPVIELAHELLQRWTALDGPHRRQLARSLLARLAPGASSATVSSLPDEQLRRRLEQLIGGAPDSRPSGGPAPGSAS